MRGNTFGSLFRLSTFGESHGPAIGGVLDGCPAGMRLDPTAIQVELDRRRPGGTPLGTSRTETDAVEFLSGMIADPEAIHRSDQKTLGTPIAFLIRNADARSHDYDQLKDVYRPGHADLTWEAKFGLRDHRGGGRSSARTTAACVVGGAIARQLLASEGIEVDAYVSRVGEVALETPVEQLDLSGRWNDLVRCPDPATAKRMAAFIEQVRSEGDSIGGVVSCVVRGVPPGLGEPVFDKLEADLAKAMLSINACKGFQIGNGFGAAHLRGSENNDAFAPGYRRDPEVRIDPYTVSRAAIRTETNRSGGVLGGISNGEDLLFEVAFKAPSTIAKAQRTVNTNGEAITLEASGRHDPCVVPRAVPIVEAMTCLVLADHLLRHRTSRVGPPVVIGAVEG